MRFLILLLAGLVTYVIAETDSTTTKSADTIYSVKVSAKMIKGNIQPPSPLTLYHVFYIADTTQRPNIERNLRPLQVDTNDVVCWKKNKNGKITELWIK